MVAEAGFQGFPAMLEEMEAMCYLHGWGCTTRRRIDIPRTAVVGNHGQVRLGLKPRGHTVRCTLGEQRDRLVALEVNADRAVGATLLPCPVVKAYGLRIFSRVDFSGHASILPH